MSNTGYPIILSNGTTLGGSTYLVLDVSQVANSIADTSLTSLALYRRGARNYSEIMSENMVHLLENFSSSTPPLHPIRGQTWFNNAAGAFGQLMVYNSNSSWVTAGNPLALGLANAVNISLANDATGTASFDGTTNITIPVSLKTMPGLAAGTYVSPTLTIDVNGRITAASGSIFGANAIISALGYVPANDASVVHKTGDTMTGTLNVTNADVNTTGTGLLKQNGSALLPSGVVVMWSGSSASIPAGWHLCDGTNGTPNLQGKFIVGAGANSGYSDGQTGGVSSQSFQSGSAGSHSHGMTIQTAGAHTHTGATGSYALQIADIPSHTHAYGTSQTNLGGPGANYDSGGDNTVFNNPAGAVTGATGGGGGHSHTISSDGVHTHTGITDTAITHTHSISFDNRAPYYALAFIMKL